MRSTFHRFRYAIRALGFAAVAVLFAVQPALGYLGDQYDPTPGDQAYPRGSILTYSWLPGHVPPAWMQGLIREEVAHLNDGTQGARLPVFRYVTDPRIAYLRFGYGIPQSPHAPVCASRKTIVCVSRDPSTPRHDAIVLFAKDVRDGSHYPWQKWCQYQGAERPHWPASCFDVRHITLRAMGFVYGLHRWDRETWGEYGPGAWITVMSAWARHRPLAGFDRIDFGRCDVARLQLLYDVLNPHTLYSTCLDRVPTSLQLAASDTSVDYHMPVEFTAKLNVSTLQPEPFKGNVLSGRTVVLQSSADGFTTTTETVMEPGPNGTYHATVTPIATAKYRAVFRSPKGDALSGDTSSVIEVTVAPCTTDCPTPTGG